MHLIDLKKQEFVCLMFINNTSHYKNLTSNANHSFLAFTSLFENICVTKRSKKIENRLFQRRQKFRAPFQPTFMELAL